MSLVLHLVCHNDNGVIWETDNIFITHSWHAMRNANWLALHEHRSLPSYRQGRILNRWLDENRRGRYIFRVEWCENFARWPNPSTSGVLQYGDYETSFENPVMTEESLGAEETATDHNVLNHVMPDMTVDTGGHLYIMGWDDDIESLKIGQSDDPALQAMTFGDGSSRRLCILRVWQNKGHLAPLICTMFSTKRIQDSATGEAWFRIGDTQARSCIEIVIAMYASVHAILAIDDF